MRVVAGIVTYNPEVSLLQENIRAVLPQVSELVIVDNASQNLYELREVISSSDDPRRIALTRNPDNFGVSRALNQVMAWSAQRGAESVLLLDQDSTPFPDLVDRLSGASAEDVGMIAPTVVDRNLPTGSRPVPGVAEINYCITSGSMCRVAAWKVVKGYDERMFIDFVDFDFCLRLRMQGFRILRVQDAVLLHAVGDSRRHGRVIAYNHSAPRLRHMAQDMVYYARKHRHSPRELKVQGRGRLLTYVVLARKAAIVAGHEKDRLHKVGALFAGAWHGTFNHVSP